MHRLILSLILPLLIIPLATFAGTTGKISGHIRDSQTHEAIAGVNVLIEGTSLGAAADMDGYYAIINIPPGKHTVVASAVGYIKKSITDVSVSIDLTTTLDIDMSSTVLEVTKEIVVTAERAAIQKDLTSSEARVDASQIKTLPVSEVNDILTLQTGITTDAGGGIHIRGGRTDEVAYWVDGVSVTDAYDGSQAVQVENNAIQELQVVSGTYNAEYGQAMSGIVNIVTKEGEQKYHGNISTYVGGHYTSDSYKFSNQVIYLSEGQYQVERGNNEIYYNLGTFRPFDTRDFEGSLSGPLPGINGLTFYGSGRYYKTNGWLYGNRIFNPNGTLAVNNISVDYDTATQSVTGYTLPDNPVAMNDRVRYSGQGKLAYQFTGTMKITLNGLYSHTDYRNYNQDYFLLPDGDVRDYDNGFEGSAIWTHTLGSNSFYTVDLAYFLTTFKEYLYENPLDPNYVTDPTVYAKPVYSFNTIGTNLHHFKRSTETRNAKIDYTNQINQLHQVKLGAEVKLYRLYLEDFNVAPGGPDNSGNYYPIIPDPLGPLYQEYTRTPVEFSGYIQDKLEYEHMIVNVGLRYDYFNSKGDVLAFPLDPNVYLPQLPEHQAMTLAQRLAIWYRKATAKSSLSPRLGISYPITDKGVIHFSYGHFLKRPDFQRLYQQPGYKVTTASGTQGVYGNPDLKPEQTTQYEIGLQQQLTPSIVFDVTGFYRDTRDWVQSGVAMPVRDAASATVFYTMYVNRDYENTRGITLSVEKRPTDLLSFNLAYTLQIADATNSNPDNELAALQNNTEPARALTPADWDQTHTVNLTLGLGRQDWGAFVIGRYGSGLPYTPSINQADLRGADVATVVQNNSRRKPVTYGVDMRLFKNITLSNLNFSVFLKVFNLLDRRNALTVYGQTGQPTTTLEALGVGNLSGSNRINPASAYIIQPGYYSEPREVQLGVELGF